MPAPIDIPQKIIDEIYKFHCEGLGARKTAKKLGITRHRVQKVYKQLNLELGHKNYLKKEIPNKKACIKCGELKEIGGFRKRERNGRVSYESCCLICEKEISRKQCKQRYQNNKQWAIEYRHKNKDKINAWRKEKIRTDITFKIRTSVSSRINSLLRKQNSGKQGKSCLDFLPYTFKELKEHLEAQFEPWMNWGNWGPYKLEIWKDNDQSTWTWQIDHKIPAVKFKYKSVHDEEFIECWDLKNLRPYSAKKNIKDGHRR